MKKITTLIYLTLLSSTLFSPPAKADLVEDAAKDCDFCEAWNKPQPPFKVFGNTWYVGTHGLASILIVTDEGLILIDGALSQSARLIKENIRQAGFDPSKITYILNSHAHYDHAGGIAALQRFSGAKVLASSGSLEVLQSGELTAEDPQFDFGLEANRFPGAANVALIADQETLNLGNTTLTAHYTPGHTPGGTTWTWQSCEASRCLNVVYADSLSPVSAEGFRFSDPNASPNNAEQISNSLALIRALPCDILLAPHPFLIQMEEKLATIAANPGTHPFVDSSACAGYTDYFEQWLGQRMSEEQESSAQ